MILKLNGILSGVTAPDALGGAERTALEIWQNWSQRTNVEVRVLTDACGAAAGKHFGFEAPYINSDGEPKPLASRLGLVKRTLCAVNQAVKYASDITMTSSMYFFDVVPAVTAKALGRTRLLAVRIPHFVLPPRARPGKLVTNAIAYVEQRLMFELSLLFGDLYLVDNDAIVARLRSRSVPADRIKIARVGHKPVQPEPVALPASDYAIYVGRRSNTKGVPDLIEAWKIIARAHPSVTLVMAGYDDVGFNTRMLLHEAGIEDRVMLLERMTDGNIEYLLRNARFFVMPSKEEGFGRVVLEALAAGIPCVTFSVPAFDQAFPIGRHESTDPSAAGLARACLELLEREEPYQRLRRQARDEMRAMDWHEISDDLLHYLLAHLAARR